MRPSPPRARLPAASASAPRPFQSPKLTAAFSSSGVPPASTMRNSPLRSRSLRMVEVTTCAAAGSPAKLGMATGMRLAPAPVISMDNWALTAAAAKRHSRNRNLRKMDGIIGVIG